MNHQMNRVHVARNRQDKNVDPLESSIDRLRHPKPGSRIEAARDFGVDLNLLIANLRLTPAERVSRMHEA